MNKYGIPVVLAMLAMCTISSAAVVVDFNSSSNVVTTGGLVDSWTDTVAAKAATPSGGSANRRPTLVSNIFAGGQPGIQFDADTTLSNRDILEFSDSGMPTGDFSIVTAVRLNALESGSNTRPTWFTYGNQGSVFQLIGVAVDRPVGGNDVLARMNGTDVHSNLAMSIDTNYVVLITRSGNNYTIDLMDENGTTSAAVANASLNLTLSRGTIGNLVTPAHGDFQEAGLDGYLGRIQVYNTALSAGERTTLLGQLQNYVIPEPATMALLGIGGLMVLRRRRAA